MRIAMMGSGGVGGYFGARMASGGSDVTFIARGEHLTAIQSHGLRVDSRDMGNITIYPANATKIPAEVGIVDCVIVAVKLWDTEETGRAILPMLGSETAVLSLQNGVEGDAVLAGIVGDQRIISGVAFIASSIGEPGVIKHIGTMQRVVIGESNGASSPRIKALHEALTKGSVVSEISSDVERTIWEKFVFLIGLSATTTLMRKTLGPIRQHAESRQLLLEVMQETVAVGRARGVRLSEDFAEDRLEFADQLPPDMTSSMHHDLESGKPLELAWLSGAVVRFGKESNILTPANKMVFDALEQYAPGIR
jgi:2-dehydropantoate 2-reductase